MFDINTSCCISIGVSLYFISPIGLKLCLFKKLCVCESTSWSPSLCKTRTCCQASQINKCLAGILLYCIARARLWCEITGCPWHFVYLKEWVLKIRGNWSDALFCKRNLLLLPCSMWWWTLARHWAPLLVLRLWRHLRLATVGRKTTFWVYTSARCLFFNSNALFV